MKTSLTPILLSFALLPSLASFGAMTFTDSLTSLGPNMQIADPDGFGPDGTTPNGISFSPLGATFSSGGNEARNYLRTLDSDYNTGSYSAEFTWDGIGTTFIGFGGGNVGTFGTPDWDVADSLWMEFNGTTASNLQGVSATGRFATALGAFNGSVIAGSPVRFRMTYDFATNTLQFFADNNYAGGAFAADVQTIAFAIDTLGGGPGFLEVGDPVRFYFGGAGGTFSDLSVTAVPEPATVVLLGLAGLGFVVMRRRRTVHA